MVSIKWEELKLYFMYLIAVPTTYFSHTENILVKMNFHKNYKLKKLGE
jgi:hypothetical protein